MIYDVPFMKILSIIPTFELNKHSFISLKLSFQ